MCQFRNTADLVNGINDGVCLLGGIGERGFCFQNRMPRHRILPHTPSDDMKYAVLGKRASYIVLTAGKNGHPIKLALRTVNPMVGQCNGVISGILEEPQDLLRAFSAVGACCVYV